MSWNNGNGQGNGYGQQGYGQQQAPQYQGGYGGGDVYDRLNNTKPVGGARFPFIEDGRHKLALVTLEEFTHSSDGPSARALWLVLESNKHAPGSYVVKIYKLVRPPKFPNGKTDADEFADLCRKLKGAPEGYPIGPDIRVLMKERVREQLARGTVIECTGIPNKNRTWTNLYWNAVQQTPADIAAMRAKIEQQGVPTTGNDAPQMPQQNQYQGAPHPAQMQQQYPAQTQGQYAPPQQQYQQQPMQSPVPQQQAPVAAPQQGGFLAQLPPQGNPQGGGNTGGTW